MVNLFTQFKGLEVFGTFETLKGNTLGGASVAYSQYGAEGIYHFGGNDQFYGGVRYNRAWNMNDQSVTRFQAAAGWQIIDYVILKLEYVNQKYNGFISNYGADAGFKGVMLEAAISF